MVGVPQGPLTHTGGKVGGGLLEGMRSELKLTELARSKLWNKDSSKTLPMGKSF